MAALAAFCCLLASVPLLGSAQGNALAPRLAAGMGLSGTPEANVAAGAALATAAAAGSPPTIISYTANPTKVAAGQPSTLSWVVTGNPSLSINPVVGPVTGTSVVVTPSTTGSYMLTAINQYGRATAWVTVTAGAGAHLTPVSRL